MADADSLVSAGWPKPAGIEARGTLAVTTYFGAYDFADDKRAAYESIQTREYHHVFPDALLSEVQIASSLALNCALITWKTNRLIGRKDPLEYLENRVEWADEATIEKRLRSHLISYDRLKKAHYEHLIGEALKTVLETDFQAFLRDRAALFEIAVTSLAGGNQISLGHRIGLIEVSKEDRNMTDNFEKKVAVDGPVVNAGELGSSTFSPGQALPAGPLGLGQRWTVARKREVVLRLLRDEPVQLLSRQLGVEIFRLEQWREKAIAGSTPRSSNARAIRCRRNWIAP